MLTCAFINSVLTFQKCERERIYVHSKFANSAHVKGLIMDMGYLLKTRNDSGDWHLELMLVQVIQKFLAYLAQLNVLRISD
jgi:hypothetical protein